MRLREKAGPAGWLLVPFPKTPASILRQAVKHAIGVDPTHLDDLKDPRAQAETLARLGVAVGAGMTAWNLAAQDRLTGAAPAGPDRDQWLRTHQEYSARVGDGTWISYKDALPQYAPLLAGVANAEQASRLTKKPDEVAIRALGGALQAFLRLPFVPEPVNDALDELLSGGRVTLPGVARSVERAAVRPFESMANPAVVRFGERVHEQVAGEPFARETHSGLLEGAADRFRSNTPGLETGLPVRYDVLGEPTSRQLGEVLSPVAVSERGADAVLREVERLRASRDPESGETIGKALTRMPRTVRGMTLEPDEYDDLQRRAGELIRARLERQFEASGYQALTDTAKAKVVAKLVADARSEATDEVLGKKARAPKAPKTAAPAPTPRRR